MTIESTPRRSSVYFGDGSITAFPFHFKLFSGDQAVVQLNSDLTGIIDLTYGVDYSVTLNVNQNIDAGGLVTLIDPLKTGISLIVKSGVKYDQQIDLQNAGGFYPDTIDDGLDKLTILIQQIIDTLQFPSDLPALQRVSYSDTLNVTGASVHVDFVSKKFVTEPSVLICINGAPTDVEWTLNYETVDGADYFASIDIIFLPVAVSKEFTIIVISND